MFGCLYLHGFLSSPLSKKAQELTAYFRCHFRSASLSIPALDFSPQAAIEQAKQELEKLQQRHKKVLLIGSSLGGFYATYLAHHYKVKAALINPAVRPFELFQNRLGTHQDFYSAQTHELNAAHLTELKKLDCPIIASPERLFLLLQTGDETLDYRQAAAHYLACPSHISAGGNHSYQDFIARMPMILNWAVPDALSHTE